MQIVSDGLWCRVEEEKRIEIGVSLGLKEVMCTGV